MDDTRILYKSPESQWIQYGWLKPTDLQLVMEACQFGVWATETALKRPWVPEPEPYFISGVV